MTPEKLAAWTSGLGGRRFIMCVGAGVVSTVLLVLHYLDPANFQIIILGTIGAYIAGNSFERHGPDENYSNFTPDSYNVRN